MRRRFERAVPIALALALVTFVLTRIDRHAFAASLARVSPVSLLAGAALFVLALLTADAGATALVYGRAGIPVGYAELWAVRGASYLPSLLNHHVGQAVLAMHLARAHGTPLARVAGATLVVYASWIACLLGLATITLASVSLPQASPAAHVASAALPLVGAALYALLLAVRPRALARHTLLAPLFEAGLRGHAIAIGARLPHVAVLLVGTWLPFELFGVHIPSETALALIPVLMVAVTLPITPQGLGTRDLVAATLFANYAPGATAAERLATIAAATTAWGVSITLVEIAVGLLLIRRLRI